MSIDSKIQYIAFTQLKEAVEFHKAKAGGIVVLDVKTGEVLALANLPTYNPNNRSVLTGAQLRNRVLTDTRKLVFYYRLSEDRRRVVFGGRVALKETDPKVSAPRPVIEPPY